MNLHLSDGAYELFRAPFARPALYPHRRVGQSFPHHLPVVAIVKGVRHSRRRLGAVWAGERKAL